jgi:hypothetical protein
LPCLPRLTSQGSERRTHAAPGPRKDDGCDAVGIGRAPSDDPLQRRRRSVRDSQHPRRRRTGRAAGCRRPAKNPLDPAAPPGLRGKQPAGDLARRPCRTEGHRALEGGDEVLCFCELAPAPGQLGLETSELGPEAIDLDLVRPGRRRRKPSPRSGPLVGRVHGRLILPSGRRRRGPPPVYRGVYWNQPATSTMALIEPAAL